MNVEAVTFLKEFNRGGPAKIKIKIVLRSESAGESAALNAPIEHNLHKGAFDKKSSC